ncbi:hypothetical protein [Mycolicibacterium phlei]|uniref:hypothetical protein n=1 Tax=Mycolicibacterium phlei TaxID=1771 RepID=UPI00058CA29D|nr:hypothetical protein [Mycolicibacterium phlei]
MNPTVIYAGLAGIFVGLLIAHVIVLWRFPAPIEARKMAFLAAQIRDQGWRGVSFSDRAVNELLASATSFKEMVKLADRAVQIAKEEGNELA